MVSLGRTGCGACERIHLWGQLAEGGRTGVMPAWWINPDTWIDPEEKQAQHALYDALKGRGDPLRGYTPPAGFYGEDR